MSADQKLLPCPFCGNELYIRRGVNAYGVCRTEGCFGKRLQVVSFGDPQQVQEWNRRAIPDGYVLVPIEPTHEEMRSIALAVVWARQGTDVPRCEGPSERDIEIAGDLAALVLKALVDRAMLSAVPQDQGGENVG